MSIPSATRSMLRRCGITPAIAVLGLGVATLTSAAPAATAASAGTAVAQPAGTWIEDDMDRAMQLAASSNRYLLIDFTGSDWCGWCIRLDREVFDQAHFRQNAPRDFVLVKLDFPPASSQTEEVKRKNRQWQQRLGVRGFPTIFLADAQGRPFARTGYRQGGAVPYVDHLREFVQLRRRQETLVAEAMKLEGLDRARGLGEALAVPNIMTPERSEIVDRIREVDPEDSLGLIARYADPADAAKPPAGKDDAKDEDAEKPKTPFDRDLAAVRTMLSEGRTDEVAGALRRIEREYRPEGLQLAELLLVRIDFLVALDRHSVAISQADRAMRTRGVPDEARQRIGRRKAEVLLATGKGEAALKAWDAAIALAETELATAMKADRDAFAARCRDAGGSRR
ncbi:MAG: thioredoxin family protein [Planctomycetota bacterium]